MQKKRRKKKSYLNLIASKVEKRIEEEMRRHTCTWRIKEEKRRS
jgi:hypothetical protein